MLTIARRGHYKVHTGSAGHDPHARTYAATTAVAYSANGFHQTIDRRHAQRQIAKKRIARFGGHSDDIGPGLHDAG